MRYKALPDGSSLWREDEQVAGILHHLKAATAFARGADPKIHFQRDPDNSHDPNAIKVIGTFQQDGTRISAHIGFVSADVARLITVYADGMKLRPNLKLIWRGDERPDYLLVKFDILLYPDVGRTGVGLKRSESQESSVYKPVDYEAAFDWWQSLPRNSGMFPYVCPNCGTLAPLRKRVVVSKRRCPKCREDISLARIDALLDGLEADRQKKIQSQSGCGCLILLATALYASSAAAIFICVIWTS